MSIESIEAFQNIAIEAIKILGPASIAAIVAYNVARIQIKAEITGVDKRNEFEARKAVYDILVQTKNELGKGLDNSLGNIGIILGATSETAEDNDLTKTMMIMGNSSFRLAKGSALSAMVHYQEKGLEDKEEYSLVKSCAEKIKGIELATDVKMLRENSEALIPIFEDLTLIYQSLIDEKMEKIFAPYLDE